MPTDLNPSSSSPHGGRTPKQRWPLEAIALARPTQPPENEPLRRFRRLEEMMHQKGTPVALRRQPQTPAAVKPLGQCQVKIEWRRYGGVWSQSKSTERPELCGCGFSFDSDGDGVVHGHLVGELSLPGLDKAGESGYFGFYLRWWD